MPAVLVRSHKQNPQLQEKIGIIQRQMEFVNIRERIFFFMIKSNDMYIYIFLIHPVYYISCMLNLVNNTDWPLMATSGVT